MTRHWRTAATIMVALCGSTAFADVFHDYEDFSEGIIGDTFSHTGVTYHDANTVSGFFPDGVPFYGPDDLGTDFIIERATYFYADFPDYGSPVNALTFGRTFVPGDNLTIGPLASIWMDVEELSNAVSLDLAYYENGPWGRIEYTLDALRSGEVVATDSFTISDLGGRDNPTFDTMSISGVEFDQLHLYGWLDGDYTAPRGMIDDLSIAAVPEPGMMLLLGLPGLFACRRRRA